MILNPSLRSNITPKCHCINSRSSTRAWPRSGPIPCNCDELIYQACVIECAVVKLIAHSGSVASCFFPSSSSRKQQPDHALAQGKRPEGRSGDKKNLLPINGQAIKDVAGNMQPPPTT